MISNMLLYRYTNPLVIKVSSLPLAQASMTSDLVIV
jgi:hypothetical protein